MLQLLPSARMEDKQPIHKVEIMAGFHCIIGKNGDISVGFELELPEIFTLSENDYQGLHQSFVKAMRTLPANSVIYKQDWFFEDVYKPQYKEDMGMLNQSFQRHFNERPFLNHKCYIYITKCSTDRSKHNGMGNALTRKFIVPADMLDEKPLNEFFDKLGQFKGILSDASLTVRSLTIDEIAGGDGNEIGLIEKYLTLTPDGLALQDINLESGLQIGSNYCAMFNISHVDDLPGKVGPEKKYEPFSTDRTRFSLGFASHIGLELPCNHIYSQYFFIGDDKKIIKELEGKKANLHALSKYSRENVVNGEWTEEYLNEHAVEQRLPIKAHFNVLVWTDDKETLKLYKTMAAAAITKMDCRPREAAIDIATIYWSGIPGNAGDFPREETFQTFLEQACCFLNYETNYRDSASPYGMNMTDRISGIPVFVDLHRLPYEQQVITNFNKFVLGPSGSGKSFWVNSYVYQQHAMGGHIVIVDVGHSYKGLCEYLKGIYLTYDPKNPIQFNPFFVVGDLDVEKEESIKTLLMLLWKKEDERISQAEYTTVSTSVSAYYAFLKDNPDVFNCFDAYYEFVDLEFRTLLLEDKNFKPEYFDINNYLYVLTKFYKGGEYDYLLNARKNLDLINERFIIFELDNIKDHPILFPVVTLVIMETFISKMRKIQGPFKSILIEEAWKAIAKASTADFIKYLYKTARKFNAEAIVVTQEVDDIIGNAIIKDAIINNSDTKILLDQKKFMNRFDAIQSLLGLTEKEKAQILSINKDIKKGRKYKEVFISLGGTQSKVYATEVSAEEYITFSTHQPEKLKLFGKVKKHLGDWNKAIKESAQEIREGVF